MIAEVISSYQEYQDDHTGPTPSAGAGRRPPTDSPRAAAQARMTSVSGPAPTHQAVLGTRCVGAFGAVTASR